jgi:hypothetical protein
MFEQTLKLYDVHLSAFVLGQEVQLIGSFMLYVTTDR